MGVHAWTVLLQLEQLTEVVVSEGSEPEWQGEAKEEVEVGEEERSRVSGVQ